jgi:antitoxin component of RelBE/YafQ-DinJ toxin-antitoxin module
MQWGKIAIGALIVVIVGVGAVLALKWFSPSATSTRPTLVEVPPLAPISRSSRIVIPATITLTALRDAMEQAPRDLSGKSEVPLGPSSAEIAWSAARGGFGVEGGPNGLKLWTQLRGSLRASAQMSGLRPPEGLGPPGGLFNVPRDIPGLPPGFLRPPGGQGQPQTQSQNERTNEQSAEISGDVVLTARPTLLPEWRVQPNIVSQVTISEATANFFGMRFSLSDQVRPLLERTINEQVASLQQRLGNDPFIEQAARQEWAKMCRAIPLGAAPGAPNLWLEVRPTRAIAAQPRIDQSALTLTFGVEAETRIVPNETKPTCAFPAQVQLVAQMDRGQVNLALPVDVPFTEITRLLNAQLKGKSFPEDRSGGFAATIQSIEVAASGNRLLMSLRVRANETRSWFGFGGEAMIHVWGRPALDRTRQVLRMDDISVDIQSQAAFGLLGLAARTAVPYLEKTLAENAVIDLVPLAANARKNIEAAIADFQRSADGVRVDAAVEDLRLVGIEFDAKTLRVIAEADGSVRVEVTRFPAGAFSAR